MSNGRGKNKARNKRRAHKESKGVNGATHHPLSEVQKAELDKGLVRAMQPVEAKTPWRGVGVLREPLYNPEQARENERLYPHLFQEEYDNRRRK